MPWWIYATIIDTSPSFDDMPWSNTAMVVRRQQVVQVSGTLGSGDSATADCEDYHVHSLMHHFLYWDVCNMH